MWFRCLFSALVFVSAFWIGVFIQSLVSPSTSTTYRFGNYPVYAPIQPKTCGNEEGIKLQYYYRGDVGSVGTLVVSNGGFEPIFYYVHSTYGNLIDTRIDQADMNVVRVGTRENMLEPGKIVTFSDAKYEQPSFTMTFNYRLGESTYIHHITANFRSEDRNSKGCTTD